MARKPKNKSLLISGAVVFFILIISSFLFSSAIFKDNFSKLPAFPTDSYLDGDPLWGKCEYLIKGEFQNILIQPTSKNTVLCSILNGDKKIPIPVIIPEKATKQPLQREQKVKLKVIVQEDGRIIAKDCSTE